MAGDPAADVVPLRIAPEETVDLDVRVVVALEEEVEGRVRDRPEAEPAGFHREVLIIVRARAMQQASVADRPRSRAVAEHEDEVDALPILHVGPGFQAGLASPGVPMARQDADQHLEAFHAASFAARLATRTRSSSPRIASRSG